MPVPLFVGETVAILAQGVDPGDAQVKLIMDKGNRKKIEKMIETFMPSCLLDGRGNRKIFVRAIGCEFLRFIQDLLSTDLKHNQYIRCVAD